MAKILMPKNFEPTTKNEETEEEKTIRLRREKLHQIIEEQWRTGDVETAHKQIRELYGIPEEDS